MQPLKIWIVMVEQHYANHVRLVGVCDSLENAEAMKEKQRLGDDVVIYEGEMNSDDGF